MRLIPFMAILIVSCSTKDSRQNSIEVKNESIPLTTVTTETCDSLQYNYLESIDFPFNRLDSLIEDEVDTRKYLRFKACDNLLFKNDRTDIQTYNYISLQNIIGDYYSVLVYRQMDMENCIFIYSLDKDNKIIDSKILFCMGGGYEFEKDVLIDGKITNFLRHEKKAAFSANKYISIYREFYSLRESQSDIIKIGKQMVVEYQLDSLGRFKKTREDSFEKEYSKMKYW